MRYSRNESTLSAEENLRLRSFKVAIVGCGGLGGYLIEMAARLGIGTLTVIDGDVFNLSNLNRQLLSEESNMGLYKSHVAVERIRRINSDVKITSVPLYLDVNNADALLRDHDVVLDALDALRPRFIVQQACERLGIPMIHGAIAGWYAHVATIYPGDRLLEQIYPQPMQELDNPLGNPAFTPAFAASIQIAEMLKVLLERGDTLKGQLLQVDLLMHRYETIPLKA